MPTIRSTNGASCPTLAPRAMTLRTTCEACRAPLRIAVRPACPVEECVECGLQVCDECGFVQSDLEERAAGPELRH